MIFLPVFRVIAETICALSLAWGGWYLATALAGLKKKGSYPRQSPRLRFCVVVAARNEQTVIGALVDSLLAQNYPRQMFDVWVIPNQCTDETQRIAGDHGANVLPCSVPVKTKGEVLHFAYERLRHAGYDAYCVFDADNVADENFLYEMNCALLSGAQAAQGYRDSKNPGDSVISSCSSIYYWMMDRFFNQGKAVMGLSAVLGGTGFAITQELLNRLGGWNARTISEDMELTVQCVLAGEKVAWVPDAVTYDEQPVTMKQSIVQRRRWVSGTMQVGRYYGGELWKKAENRMQVVDMGVTLLLPIYQILVLSAMAVGVVLAALQGDGSRGAAILGAGEAAKQLAAMALGSACSAALVLTLEKKWSRGGWKGVWGYGAFVFSWLMITVCCCVKRTTRWDPIVHSRNVLPKPTDAAAKILRN